LRAFNARLNVPEATVDLGAGGEKQLSWKLAVESRDQPWAAVAIADGLMSSRAEVYGTNRPER
jgi:hypothetical protein